MCASCVVSEPYAKVTGSFTNGAKPSCSYWWASASDDYVKLAQYPPTMVMVLPDASVAIQVSGSFGSRQEEAQRLGRILRPKERKAYFYSIVSHYTVEEGFAANRQKFLTEQGYKYHIELWDHYSDEPNASFAAR